MLAIPARRLTRSAIKPIRRGIKMDPSAPMGSSTLMLWAEVILPAPATTVGFAPATHRPNTASIARDVAGVRTAISPA